jgi:hypothetical protein
MFTQRWQQTRLCRFICGFDGVTYSVIFFALVINVLESNNGIRSLSCGDTRTETVERDRRQARFIDAG